MSNFETILAILILILFLGLVWAITEINNLKKQKPVRETPVPNSETLRLQLQAYERLTVLSERISLKGLLSRIPSHGLSARETQKTLIQNIRQEFDYNISQQIYIRPEIWEAVDNMKEQNIYIINQLASTLPPNATGIDLNKHILDYLLRDKGTSLHHAVNEAINSEVKKLI